MKKIYLSPSNQDANTYATGNTNEMVQCNKIADATKIALERCGFNVKKAPMGQSMYTSVEASNSWGADLHMPIHTNAYNGKVTGGTLVMLYSVTGENEKAGKEVLKEVGAISVGKNYPLRQNKELYELSQTNATAVYLEVEFHDTMSGANWILKNIANIGEAITKAICSYYGVKYVSNKEPDKPDKPDEKEMYRVRKLWKDAQSQIGAFEVFENAKKMADKNIEYNVYNSDGKKVYDPQDHIKYVELNLKNVPLYVSSTTSQKSSDVTGTYYRYDNETINGRVRITNCVENIGKANQVTGWVDFSYVK